MKVEGTRAQNTNMMKQLMMPYLGHRGFDPSCPTEGNQGVALSLRNVVRAVFLTLMMKELSEYQ